MTEIEIPKSGFLRVKVIPKSAKNEVSEIMEETIEETKVLT